MINSNSQQIRHDWTQVEVEVLFKMSLNDLLFRAHQIHRKYFDVNQVQVSTLMSIKTGGCSEDCKYCSQSARYDTGLEREKLLSLDEVIQKAKEAKEKGSERFCMGAAWRNPKDKQMPQLLEMVKAVKALGLETCMTLGMLTTKQTKSLKTAGLDYYNHNLDTSKNYYSKVITTRTYQDRLDTLSYVRDAGIKTCTGGIVGMGELRSDRIDLLITLANLPEHPDSMPINRLVPIPGTPYENQPILDDIEFVRTIAAARIMMPKSMVRLSAGRESMPDSTQALCFFAGANSMFSGEELLTAPNAGDKRDNKLFDTLGINA